MLSYTDRRRLALHAALDLLQSPLAGTHVLVVEDNDDSRELWQRVIE